MTTSAVTEEQPLGPRYAGFVSRLAAFTIDVAVIFVFSTVTTGLGQFLGRALALGNIMLLFIGLVTTSVNIAAYLAYFVGFIAVAGQTPGKRIMGLKVTADSGYQMTVRRAIRRLVGSWISLPLFWGYLGVLVNDERRAFHDKFAHTHVIYDRGRPILPDRVRESIGVPDTTTKG